MVRTSSRVITLFVLCSLAGCQSPERASITPLDANSPPLTFMELMSRGKSQLNAAQEYYFNDDWKDVEVAAVAIKETGNSISQLKIVGATAEQNAKLAQLSKEYMDAADQLKLAGAEKNPNKTSQVFQRLSEIYRQLRIEQVKLAPSNPPAPPPEGPKP
ncbi:MAG TPA: hypothetical protein PLN21_10405 [Gemmatales bacterium]|nr:hypothetical protein [Gemmatales bacterium]